MLRSALVRWWAEHEDRERGEALASKIPASFRVKRAKVEVPERVLAEIERVAALASPRNRALVMVALRTGLRAEELLRLSRAQVEEAISSGKLRFVRKGAKETELPVGHVKGYWKELLTVKAALPREDFGAPTAPDWNTLGETLAGAHATYATRYNLFNRLVKKIGKRAGVPALSPHKLRHGFATRMHRDGAPLKVVQAALGHNHLSTTERYIHVEGADVEKWVRTGPPPKAPEKK